jgi:hypothetical protein
VYPIFDGFEKQVDFFSVAVFGGGGGRGGDGDDQDALQGCEILPGLGFLFAEPAADAGRACGQLCVDEAPVQRYVGEFLIGRQILRPGEGQRGRQRRPETDTLQLRRVCAGVSPVTSPLRSSSFGLAVAIHSAVAKAAGRG